MASEVTAAPTAAPEGSGPHSDDQITVAEAGSLALAVSVGVLALVGLVAGHLHMHDPIVVIPGTAALLAVAAVALLRWERRPLALDTPGLVAVLGGAAFAAVMFFPGFEYGTGDRDPGAYIEHGVAISRTDGIEFHDDLVEVGLPGGVSPGAAWPALWGKPGEKGTIFPQFYHLWPALLATAKDVGGFFGLFNAGPALGVIAVALAVCVARRLAGLPAAWTVAVVLPSNMMQVWQAKYPSAEIFGQLLFLGVLLGAVLAITVGSRAAAAAAGLCLGLSYLERADALLVVLMAWGGLCALIAMRRFDARAWCFTIAAAALMPYALYQAYVLAETYTLVNGVPTITKVAAAMVVPGVAAVVLARQKTLVGWVVDRTGTPVAQRWIGLAFVTVCAVLLLVGWHRPTLFGKSYGLGRYGSELRNYDEISLHRLAWFFSELGLILLLVGVGYVALRKWRAEAWLVLLPTAALLVMYCWHLRNSPYLMWATRRFVTTVAPGMAIIIGCGVAACYLLVRRYLPKVVGVVTVAAVLAALGAFGLNASIPLRSHNENGGSVEVVRTLTGLAGEAKGVFLWQQATYCCNAPHQLFGGPVFAIAGHSSALTAADPAKAAPTIARYVEFYKDKDRPVFWIADRDQPVPPVPGVTATQVLEIGGALPHWEESFESRPNKRRDYGFRFRVYRLTAAG